MATVSIGMPVLNGAESIVAALASLRAQTHRDLEIVVSDNASDDDTAAVAERIAAEDARIRVVRHSTRVDILGSFRRAFEATGGPYFMFAPADDRWHETFVERNLAELERNPALGASCARVAFLKDGRIDRVSNATQPLLGSHRDNLLGYLADPADNARAFGLYRRQALAGAFPPVHFPAWDYLLIARTLKQGGHQEVPEILLWRDTTPKEKYNAEIDRAFRSRILRWMPHLAVAWRIWRDPATPPDARIAWNLVLMALRSHLSFSAVRWPRWSRHAHCVCLRLRFYRWAIDPSRRAR